MDFKRIYEELIMLLSYNSNVKVQQSQREQMAIMSFLAGLPSKFDNVKSQILSSSEIVSLKDIYSRVLHTEKTPSTPHVQFSGAPVSCNNEYESERSQYSRGNKGGGSNGNGFNTQA